MNEIFISYANEDRATAQKIARALEAEGWAVWWDRKIAPGRSFDEVIGEALDAAKCVVVLWSKFSVASNWVKEEAEEGNRRKILVPVLIDDVPIPLGFRRIQAANLVGWRESADDREFQEFRQSVARLLGSKAKEPKVPAGTDTGEQRSPVGASRTDAGVSSKRSMRRWVVSGATLIGALAAGWGAGALTAGITRSDPAGFVAAIPTWLLGLWLTRVVWLRLK